MGHKNPDRVPLSYRRVRCETVADMQAQGWDVVSKCRTCGLTMQVDLDLIAALEPRPVYGTARRIADGFTAPVRSTSSLRCREWPGTSHCRPTPQGPDGAPRAGPFRVGFPPASGLNTRR